MGVSLTNYVALFSTCKNLLFTCTDLVKQICLSVISLKKKSLCIPIVASHSESGPHQRYSCGKWMNFVMASTVCRVHGRHSDLRKRQSGTRWEVEQSHQCPSVCWFETEPRQVRHRTIPFEVPRPRVWCERYTFLPRQGPRHSWNALAMHRQSHNCIRLLWWSIISVHSCLIFIMLWSSIISVHSRLTRRINDLLKADAVWSWGRDHQQSYSAVKALVSAAPGLGFYNYDVTKPKHVSADASSYGLGGVRLQQHGQKRKPIALWSRTLTTSEQICSNGQIEIECLAGVLACERFDRFMCGLGQFKLLTDRKPLVLLINNKDLDSTPLICQRLLIRLMRYNVNTEYSPGETIVVSDALSRSAIDDPSMSSSDEYGNLMSISSNPIFQSYRGRERSCIHPREMMQLFSLQSATP